MDRTLAGIHMQNPPHYFSLGAALREFGARKLGANAHFANGVPVAQIYGRTKLGVPCSIERWENEGWGGSCDSEKTAAVESVRAETICSV